MSNTFLKKLHSFTRDKDGRLSFKAIAVIGVSVVLISALAAVLFVFPGQNERRRQLEQERAQKQRELNELLLQQEFLQELSSLTESREYLIRYLRETQGYILKGDIRIDLADPNAVIPTPKPAEEPERQGQAEQTAEPSETSEPAETAETAETAVPQD